jgi:hypothetical protein
MTFKNWVLSTTFILMCLGCNKPEPDFSGIPSDNISQLHVPGAHDFYDAGPRDITFPETDAYSCVGYKVRMKYPAESIISFYQGKLKGLGFEPYKDSKWTHGKYEWQSFFNNGFKEKPCTCQYLEDWVNKDKTRIAMLAINYYSPVINKRYECGSKPNDDLARVTIFSEPYEARIK